MIRRKRPCRHVRHFRSATYTKARGSSRLINANITRKQFLHSDFDHDGVPNYKDCRPMNPYMQDDLSSLIGVKNRSGLTFDEHDVKLANKMLTKKEQAEYAKIYRDSNYGAFSLMQHMVYSRRGRLGKVSVSDVRRKNEEKGFHFFDRGSMKFFNSRVETTGDLIKNKYFITSEQFDYNSPRQYSIRKFNPTTAGIDTVSEFGGFKSKQDAMDAIKNLD